MQRNTNCTTMIFVSQYKLVFTMYLFYCILYCELMKSQKECQRPTSVGGPQNNFSLIAKKLLLLFLLFDLVEVIRNTVKPDFHFVEICSHSSRVRIKKEINFLFPLILRKHFCDKNHILQAARYNYGMLFYGKMLCRL